ncbi:MAG: phage tail protein [Dokdonella sp.]|uniref:phage tail protein n=1 Tax=Dokdonella sp. TaxID=2291710 RepID=UPI003F7FFC29
MTTPFMSEIRLFSFSFAPRGWALCSGQILPIQQNQALFSLLGTTYGGNGVTTFALPNLQSRVPMHAGQGSNLSSRTLGELGGAESHTLTVSEMPAHQHALAATSAPPSGGPSNALLATPTTAKPYRVSASQMTSLGTSTGVGGGSQPHPNMQPYLTVNFAIALQGVYPSRN